MPDTTEMPYLPPAGELNLVQEWTVFTANERSSPYSAIRSAKQITFLKHLREIVSDPDAVNDIVFCEECDNPNWKDDLNETSGGIICESCYDTWDSCACCENRYPDSQLTVTLNDSQACDSCRADQCTFCENCDGYYWDDDADSHV